MRLGLLTTVGVGVLWVACGACAMAQTSAGGWQGAYATGNIATCLPKTATRSGRSRPRLTRAYQQLFHGDPQTQAIAFAAGSNANGPLMYVTDWANHDVRTEGMSYGMMIAVQLDKKAEFDAIWNWAKTYMYISDPKAPSYEFFAWSCKTDGTHNSEGAAPDGESYFAMALLFAVESLGRRARDLRLPCRGGQVADGDGASAGDFRRRSGSHNRSGSTPWVR